MIVKAGINDAQMLANLGAVSFRESHAASASAAVIDSYTGRKYHPDWIVKEMGNPNILYYLITHNDHTAGFSKMLLRQSYDSSHEPALSKLEQLYLLHTFKGLQLGAQLMTHNLQLSKQSGQKGMWLEVWAGNTHAISFYEKFGFAVIAAGKFELTPEHSNLEYVMLLKY